METTVEIKIQKFVLTYGAEQLILWLDQFDRVISSRDYPRYRKLEREACRSCGITLADMKMFSNTACTNTKRIISFIAFHQLHIPVPSISVLLNVSERTVNYYINSVEDWVSNPKSNRVFIDEYNRVIENFKPE